MPRAPQFLALTTAKNIFRRSQKCGRFWLEIVAHFSGIFFRTPTPLPKVHPQNVEAVETCTDDGSNRTQTLYRQAEESN